MRHGILSVESAAAIPGPSSASVSRTRWSLYLRIAFSEPHMNDTVPPSAFEVLFTSRSTSPETPKLQMFAK